MAMLDIVLGNIEGDIWGNMRYIGKDVYYLVNCICLLFRREVWRYGLGFFEDGYVRVFYFS